MRICTKIIFKIPIRQGEIKTLSKIEFEQMKTLPLPPPPMSTGAEKIMINLERRDRLHGETFDVSVCSCVPGVTDINPGIARKPSARKASALNEQRAVPVIATFVVNTFGFEEIALVEVESRPIMCAAHITIWATVRCSWRMNCISIRLRARPNPPSLQSITPTAVRIRSGNMKDVIPIATSAVYGHVE